MPVINRVAEFQAEIAGWRRDFHAHPELLYDVHRTAGRVAELLRTFGVDEVVTGIGRTGVVGVIKGAAGRGRTIGLRADMDALPITERTGKPYASSVPGKMHACGHDGHTAMLLGAAKYLAETRNFDGTAVVIFQPAEEGGARRQGDARGRPDGAVRHRRGLRHAQHAGHAGRAVRHPRGRHHGGDRRVQHRRSRAAAGMRRCRTRRSTRSWSRRR